MIFYIYFGYPLVITLIALIKKNPIDKKTFEPRVSLIITAYNEESCIASSLQNKLKLNYPKDKIEIIVVSDGSTDKTDEIVHQFSENGVKLIRQNPRAGKTQALNRAVANARGEIIIFADANSIYHADALKEILNNFHDPKVGYVTGQMKYVNPDGSMVGDGCSIYMKYENYLRKKETLVGSIVGVDGGIDAVRRKLYIPMSMDQLPDLVLPLQVVKQGYRVVYEPSAILEESTLSHSKDEYHMRVRVSLRALWAIKDMRMMLSLRNFGLYAFQIWSHKVFRYFAFIFMILTYFSNFLLYPNHIFFKVIFIIQNIFYFIFIISFFMENLERKINRFYFVFYFVLINIAAAHATIKFLMGKKLILWTPRKGS
jgi:cellulose synthase/poly-beta-1,6-N-acetylglucosamine synthase-like glycosyltransferase